MYRFYLIGVFALVLGSCAAPKMVWLRTDGQYVAHSPALQTQFAIDETTCDGEAQKANLSAGTNYYGGVITRAVEEGRRNQAMSRVLEGCMAGKGYVHVVEAQAADSAATLAATQKDRQKLDAKPGAAVAGR